MRGLAALLPALCAGCGYQSPSSSKTPDGASADSAIDGATSDAAADSAIACAGYLANGGSAYRTSTADADWPTAKATCESLSSGHLVVIADPTEDAIVRALLPMSIRFWIGMSDLGTEDTWLWLDGTAVPRAVQFWDPTQPNDNQMFGGEDCGEMSNTGTWNDKSCGSVQPYVCECP